MSEDKTWTKGPWTTFTDRVHGHFFTFLVLDHPIIKLQTKRITQNLHFKLLCVNSSFCTNPNCQESGFLD